MKRSIFFVFVLFLASMMASICVAETRQAVSIPSVHAMTIYYPSGQIYAYGGARLIYYDDDSVSFCEANQRNLRFNLTRDMLDDIESYVKKAKKWAQKNTELRVDESQGVGTFKINNIAICEVWFQAFKQGNSEISVHFRQEATNSGFGLIFPAENIDTLTNAWSEENTYDKYMPEFEAKKPKKHFF